MISFYIPFELPTMNQYINACKGNKHWSSKIKRDVESDIISSLLDMAPQFMTLEYPLDCEFIWMCKNRKKDPDNVAFGKKFIFDALCKAELMEGDGWKYINSLRDVFPEPVKERVGVTVTMDSVREDRFGV